MGPTMGLTQIQCLYHIFWTFVLFFEHYHRNCALGYYLNMFMFMFMIIFIHFFLLNLVCPLDVLMSRSGDCQVVYVHHSAGLLGFFSAVGPQI